MATEIKITGITEGNKSAKYAELEKALTGRAFKNIKTDNTRALQDISLILKDMSRPRVEKALRTMSMSLGVPEKADKGEVFFYQAQEDLTNRWYAFFADYTRETYNFVTDFLGLPKKTIMSKADNLTHKGKILYYPESGEPIKKADWDKFVKNLEKFLNRNIVDAEKKIILESNSLGKILDRMLKYNTLEAVRKLQLEKLTYHGKTFDWISESTKNMKNVFGESLTRKEMTRIEMLQQSAGQKITGVTDKVRNDVKQILIDGVKARQSKGQVSQALFDKMVGDNRDYQRLADTEIQNAFNNASIREEVYNTPEGEETYFQRIEVIDSNTCPFCRQMNGKIAVWSEKPQKDQKAKDGIADYVIWEGKEWSGRKDDVCTGAFHPFCRGYWARYDNKLDNFNIDAIVAENSNRAKKWNSAVKQATEEFEDKGIKNPDDSTKGFTERIKELYNGADSVEKSLTFSGHNGLVNKLFRLWQRRLSPELQKEMLKLMDDERDYFYLIPKKVYEIEGYPEGQDLENCELFELADTYFVISCGGDWQDEKLVKFEIGDNDKLSAKVITDCEKEDKRVLKKKVAYILNSESVNKSMFTDWKVELHHLCEEKGLDYDSIIQKYDDKLTRFVAEEQLGQDAENVIAYKAYKDLNKSLTWSGHKLQGRTTFNGLNISIENKKGSIRRGVDSDGHKWAIKMHFNYGYIRGTEGVDGDHVDCYIGDNIDAKNVYIIHQKIPGTDKYDEDKCMLGFDTLADAKAAYLRQYDKPGFFGGVDTVPFDVFKNKVLLKKWHGKRLNLR